MKRLKLAVVLSVFAVLLTHTVYAQDMVNAYVENGRLVVEDREIERAGGEKNDIAALSFYDADGMLCGASIAEKTENGYEFKRPSAYSKIRIWISGIKDENNAVFGVFIIQKPTAAPTLSPSPAPSPTQNSTPVPAEEIDPPSDEYIEEEKKTAVCTVSIGCATALSSTEIDSALLAELPADGIMLPLFEVSITEGMTVYDVLLLAAEKNGLEITGSESYIEGINGLGEFSCGALSGWKYSVNGEFPSLPVNRYTVSENDEIAFLYTCALGEDL